MASVLSGGFGVAKFALWNSEIISMQIDSIVLKAAKFIEKLKVGRHSLSSSASFLFLVVDVDASFIR